MSALKSSTCTNNGAVEKVLFRTIATACAVNICKPPVGVGGHVSPPLLCLPLSSVQNNRNRLRCMVLVSINRVDECINRADQRATGGHASPPLRFVDIFSTAP